MVEDENPCCCIQPCHTFVSQLLDLPQRWNPLVLMLNPRWFRVRSLCMRIFSICLMGQVGPIPFCSWLLRETALNLWGKRNHFETLFSSGKVNDVIFLEFNWCAPRGHCLFPFWLIFFYLAHNNHARTKYNTIKSLKKCTHTRKFTNQSKDI